VIAARYLFLLLTSGLVVNRTISGVMKEPLSSKVSKKTRDTGFVVGKCENILILTFMLLGAYTALALVLAAKAKVSKLFEKQEAQGNNDVSIPFSSPQFCNSPA